MDHFYRFRPAKALLDGYHELERQEIYFCPSTELNDPMEGFKDLYWQGDAIVWRNLLKHYLLCLETALGATIVAERDHLDVVSEGFIFATAGGLPSEIAKSIHAEVCAAFFADPQLARVPDALAKRPHKVRRDELHHYLRGLHPHAFRVIADTLRRHRLLPPVGPKAAPPVSIEEHLAGILRTIETTGFADPEKEVEAFRHLYESMWRISDEIDLIDFTHQRSPKQIAWHHLMRSFPGRYVRALDRLVHHDWAAACFVAEPNHAAMWGAYADGHKGLCLKFKAQPGDQGPTLALSGPMLSSDGRPESHSVHRDSPFAFERMRYVEKFPEIDFFRSLGRLPFPVLKNEWYTDHDGKLSDCAAEISSLSDAWHTSYWDAFQAVTSAKFRDWHYEQEFRLVLTSQWTPLESKDHRKLTYRFDDLAGIIFGINTPLDVKRQVSDIIEVKCKQANRTDFEFSQAAYSPTTGRIEIHVARFLKYST